MNKFVWTNPYLPQTLQISVFLAYFHAVFVAIGLILPYIPILRNLLSIFIASYTTFGYLLTILGVLGAFGIANLRLWGYYIGVAVAILSVVTLYGRLTQIIPLGLYFEILFSRNNLINLIFGVAIIALLLHTESRDFIKRNFEKTIP